MLQIQNQTKSDPAGKPVLSQMTRDPMYLSAHQEHPWCTLELYAEKKKEKNEKKITSCIIVDNNFSVIFIAP